MTMSKSEIQLSNFSRYNETNQMSIFVIYMLVSQPFHSSLAVTNLCAVTYRLKNTPLLFFPECKQELGLYTRCKVHTIMLIRVMEIRILWNCVFFRLFFVICFLVIFKKHLNFFRSFEATFNRFRKIRCLKDTIKH